MRPDLNPNSNPTRRHKQGGETKELSNGLYMPLVGLGTGGIQNIQDVATRAMDMGYGLLNTGHDLNLNPNPDPDRPP